jgi:2',3'-cyclic-nucleotide 2'-phosphodiesterase (5'-nucleotidase family)
MMASVFAVPTSASGAVGTDGLAQAAIDGQERNSDSVQLQILAINDFHGNIATSSGSFGGVGRADYTTSRPLRQ